MSVKRIAALVCIYAVAVAGWMILGGITAVRSDESGRSLGMAVEDLWGSALVQTAPSFAVEIPGCNRVRWIMPSGNDIRVRLTTDYRRKGLIWYPTYVCRFEGTYAVTNTDEVAQKITLRLDLPVQDGTYDEFKAYLNDREVTVALDDGGNIREIFELEPEKTGLFRLTYETRGMGEWRYRLDRNVGRVRNLDLTVTTNFADVDYGEDSLSPMSAGPLKDGMRMTWKASDLITRQDIGVVIPEKLNPGPLASRITFFAPVCLVFFFVLIVTINIVCRVNIHPMHYLFVAAGFFAFHLLLAYLVDHLAVHPAFAISAVMSVALVTSYLRAALGREFPWKIAAAGQLFFLVLFSYSFFLEAMTGLTVAVGSVVTLAILMKVTAHIDWDAVFAGGDRT